MMITDCAGREAVRINFIGQSDNRFNNLHFRIPILKLTLLKPNPLFIWGCPFCSAS